MQEITRKGEMTRERRIMFLDLAQKINDKYGYAITARVEFGYFGDEFNVHDYNKKAGSGVLYRFVTDASLGNYETDTVVCVIDPGLNKAEKLANKIIKEGLL